VKKIRKVVKPVDPIELPTFDERYATIMERSQEFDPIKEWETIRLWLQSIPISIQEMRDLVKHHADIAERAKRLANGADSELKLFELKCLDRKQIWRIASIAHWEREKEQGNITKQITEKMIEDWIIEQHGELYINLETKRIQLESVRDQLKSLATQVSAKGYDLRKLLESETRRPSGSPNWMDSEN